MASPVGELQRILYVEDDADIRAVALPVLRHRLVPSFHAEAEGLGPDDIVGLLLDDVPTFNPRNEYDEVSRRILRL